MSPCIVYEGNKIGNGYGKNQFTSAQTTGENNVKAKLTIEQVKEIYLSERPRKELADSYGVTTVSIGHIKGGKTWQNVTSTLSRM